MKGADHDDASTPFEACGGGLCCAGADELAASSWHAAFRKNDPAKRADCRDVIPMNEISKGDAARPDATN